MKWWLISILMLCGTSALPAQTAGDGTAAAPADTVAVSLSDTVASALPAVAAKPDSAAAERAAYYERYTMRYRRLWSRLVPRQSVVQFAGSVGIMSFGLGWHYGRRDSWETEVLVGWVPRYDSQQTKTTLTLKERFVPWHLAVSSRWVVEPLTAGMFFNTIFGEDFWAHQPSRYPKKYYGFPTKVRTHVFVGQRLRYRIPSRHRIWNKSISAYYELSTCDLYVVSAIPNRNVRLGDILSLAVGLRMEIF